MDAPVRKGLGDYIRQVGAYGIILTVFSLGVGLCSVFWSSTVSSLNQQITQSRNELNKATSELEKVKADYFAYRTLHGIIPPSDNESIVSKAKPSLDSIHGKIGSVPEVNVVPAPPAIDTKRIDAGKSAQFFNDLTISLVSTNYSGESSYLVTANVSSENGNVEKMNGREVGGILDYAGKEKYRIIILEASTFSAVFKVTIQK